MGIKKLLNIKNRNVKHRFYGTNTKCNCKYNFYKIRIKSLIKWYNKTEFYQLKREI